MGRSESVETEARGSPEERAAQAYSQYGERCSDKAARRSDRIGGRSRRIVETGS